MSRIVDEPERLVRTLEGIHFQSEIPTDQEYCTFLGAVSILEYVGSELLKGKREGN